MQLPSLCRTVLSVWRDLRRRLSFCIHEQDQGPIVTHREPRDLLARAAVADVGQFVTRPISFDLERRDFIAKVLFKARLAAELEPANVRVQAISTDHKIEVTRGRPLERNVHNVLSFCEVRNPISEDRLDSSLDGAVDRSSELSARDADVATAGRRLKDFRREPADPPVRFVNELDSIDEIAGLQKLGDDSHLLGDAPAESPEVDDVASGA
jgi:hypothetical protein